jgi:hypothetical protein
VPRSIALFLPLYYLKLLYSRQQILVLQSLQPSICLSVIVLFVCLISGAQLPIPSVLSGLVEHYTVPKYPFYYCSVRHPHFYDFSTSLPTLPTLLRIDTFQTQVQYEFNGLYSEIATLRIALAKTQASRPYPKLPDPEKFTGSTYKFNTWLPLIEAKLAVDSTAIRDATAQFYYIYLNLNSSVQSMVLPQLSYAKHT